MSCLRNLKIKLKDMETEECSFVAYFTFVFLVTIQDDFVSIIDLI